MKCLTVTDFISSEYCEYPAETLRKRVIKTGVANLNPSWAIWMLFSSHVFSAVRALGIKPVPRLEVPMFLNKNEVKI